MTCIGDQVRLDYAYYGSAVTLPDGWGEHRFLRYRHPVAIIRQNPFTIELRRTTLAIRQAMIRSVFADLGLPEKTNLVPCELKTEKLRKILEQKQSAIAQAEKRIGRGKGLKHLIVSTDRSISLYDQEDYLRNDSEDGSNAFTHHEVHDRSWFYVSRHADGYMEQATYTIVLETGDMRLSEHVSERAIDNLRANVIALF